MKAVELKRNDFEKHLKGVSVDVATLSGDARLKGVDVKGADQNGDGKISGKDETRALFDAVDKFDSNGKSNSVRLIERDGTATAVRPQIEAIGDASGVQALRALASVNGPRRGNDDVMHVGMRDANKLESDKLDSNLKGSDRLVRIGGKNDTAFKATDGNTYDLSSRSGIDGFAKTLGLPADQTKSIADAIESNPQKGRDELASMATEWAKAEKGGSVPSRLSISGHHAGGQFWGEKGKIERQAVLDLAAAMPKAAGQVEDIHLAACYCQGRNGVRQWQAVFPNAKTILAYSGSTPESERGGVRLQANWERATRGDAQKVKSGVEGSVVWTRAKGFQDGDPEESVADLKAERARLRPKYDDYFSGAKEVGSHSNPDLRAYYNRVGELAVHPDATEAERKQYAAETNTTIRLIYFDKLAPKWAAEHKTQVADGYAAAGLTAPDFGSLSRKDAVKSVDDFLARTAGSKDAKVIALRTELELFKNLDLSRFPAEWI